MSHVSAILSRRAPIPSVLSKQGEEQFVRISSIPMNQLDTIKSWLDEVADVVRHLGRHVCRGAGSP